MNNAGMPLSALPGLSARNREHLANNWFETVEELYAGSLALGRSSTVGDAAGRGKQQSLAASLPMEAVFRETLSAPKFTELCGMQVPEHGMGLSIPSEQRATMFAAYCARQKANGGKQDSTRSFADSGEGLPAAVRLMDKMPAIRDQGSRGTCTAFASVALCEFDAADGVTLSPQFIYWASKRRDGCPNESGTWLTTVQEALFEDGVCTERDWPYNPLPRGNDEGQGPAPAGAIQNAKSRTLATRAITANSVVKFKRLLSEGLPIVIGVATFDSWVRNVVTARTGKITLPLCWEDDDGNLQIEEPSGGHAMCVVGYQNDASVPGGGYFIVRNSWGVEWAAQSKEAPGHALMPYAYVENFCHSAFTVLREDDADSKSSKAEAPMPEPPRDLPRCLRPFARMLASETRDCHQRLLPRGTCVLSLPAPNSPVFEYSQRNLATPEYAKLMNYVQFRPQTDWPKEVVAAFDEILRYKEDFRSKLGGNMAGLVSPSRRRYPISKFSWRLQPIGGLSYIWGSKVVDEFSDELFAALIADARLDERFGQPPDKWIAAMKRSVSARIWRCSAFGILPFLRPYVTVVEVFATPFAIDDETGACMPTEPTDSFAELVMTCAEARLRKLGRGQYVFFSIGSGLAWRGGKAQVKGSDYCLVKSSPTDAGGWDVCQPGYLTASSFFRDFVDRLVPVSAEDRMSAVKTVVDRQLGFAPLELDTIVNDVHADKSGAWRNLPPFRRTVVRRILLHMQKNDPDRYVVCHGKGTPARDDSALYILKKECLDEKKDVVYHGRHWLLNFLIFHSIRLSSVVFGVVLWRCRDWLMGKLGLTINDITGILVVALFIYIGSLLQTWVNQRVVIERE